MSGLVHRVRKTYPQSAKRPGWTVERTRGDHVAFIHLASRKRVHAALSPSDWRADMNLLADMRRLERGLETETIPSPPSATDLKENLAMRYGTSGDNGRLMLGLDEIKFLTGVADHPAQLLLVSSGSNVFLRAATKPETQNKNLKVIRASQHRPGEFRAEAALEHFTKYGFDAATGMSMLPIERSMISNLPAFKLLLDKFTPVPRKVYKPATAAPAAPQTPLVAPATSSSDPVEPTTDSTKIPIAKPVTLREDVLEAMRAAGAEVSAPTGIGKSRTLPSEVLKEGAGDHADETVQAANPKPFPPLVAPEAVDSAITPHRMAKLVSHKDRLDLRELRNMINEYVLEYGVKLSVDDKGLLRVQAAVLADV